MEAPSQMLEEWMRSPQVLAKFAKNYKTGEPIPADLVARMNRASAFGRGNWVIRQNSYTAISYNLYKGNPQRCDPDAVADEALRHYALLNLYPAHISGPRSDIWRDILPPTTHIYGIR